MSRWGRCDFSQFREFAKGFEKLSDSETVSYTHLDCD